MCLQVWHREAAAGKGAALHQDPCHHSASGWQAVWQLAMESLAASCWTVTNQLQVVNDIGGWHAKHYQQATGTSDKLVEVCFVTSTHINAPYTWHWVTLQSTSQD